MKVVKVIANSSDFPRLADREGGVTMADQQHVCGDIGMHWWTKQSDSSGFCQCGLIPARLFFSPANCDCDAKYPRRGPKISEIEWEAKHADSCPYKDWLIERRVLVDSRPFAMATILVCSKCGSGNVLNDAWVHANTGDVQTFDEAFCVTCDGPTTLVSIQFSTAASSQQRSDQ